MLLAFGIDASLPAFDDIRAAFDMAPDDTAVTMTVTVYFIGLAFGQLGFGVLSDSIGRLRALHLGLAFYMLGAITAALAPSFTMLLFARFLWGLGAAGPGVMRSAIARDLYDGDQMTRVVTIVMAVFLIGPIFVPFIGVGILSIGSWRWVYLSALVIASIAVVWAFRFGETLPPEARQPFTVQPLLKAARAVMTTPQTIGRIAAQTMFSAAFFVFLGSAQPIISRIYNRDSQFAWWFAAIGTLTILMLLINNQLIKRFGSARLLVTFSVAEVVVAAIGLAIFIAADGVPRFGVWFVWVAAASILLTLIAPLCNGLALEPMGAIAGTASAVLGFFSMAGGAILASLIDARIEGTVTPMALGYLVFSGIGLGFVWWAQTWRGSPSPA